MSFGIGLAQHSSPSPIGSVGLWPDAVSAQPLFSRWANDEKPPVQPADPAACFVHEMADAVAADGICVVWHGKDTGGSPHILTAPHGDAATEEILHAAALTRHLPLNGPSWRGTDSGDLMRFDVIGDDGYVALIALFRSPRHEASARDSVERSLPMMQAFLAMWIARLQAEARASALTAAVNKGGAAIILADGSARLLFANDGATDMLDRHDGICRNGELLGGNRLADTLRLRGAIEHVMQLDHRDPDVSPVVALPRSSGRPLLVAIVAADRALADEHEHAAILYLFDPDQDIRLLAEPACRFYGLSPVETKLTCLLADGHSLADAAKTMRIREQTARSYLKQIFSKTATNRQAELVQLMLKSLVRTASRCVTRFI